MTAVKVPGDGWELMVQGSYADLYLVKRDDGGDPLVAKVLREDSPEARRAFAREFRVLAGRVHSAFVAVLGGDPDGPRPHYFMPYFAGGALTRWAGAIDHSSLRSIFLRIAEAIAALHAENMQHGDIKPDNIFVSKRGTVQVGDPLGNGSGCTVSWGTKWGGTPGYWAPEVAVGGPISAPGDVYSLGATMFHLATGVAPTGEQTLDPLPPVAALPKVVGELINIMCRSDPARRPTMQQVVLRLRGDGAGVPAPQPSRPIRPAGNGLRGFLALLGGAALALAAIDRMGSTWDPAVQRYRGRDGRFK